MFTNLSGQLRADAEVLTEAIRSLSQEDDVALNNRKETLRRALTGFEAQLRKLPHHERQATLSLLYHRLADELFDFQLSLLTTESRQRIQMARTREEKLLILKEFRTSTDALAKLHGVK